MISRAAILVLSFLLSLGVWWTQGQPWWKCLAGALAAMLWTRFSMRLSGSTLAGVVTGLLTSIASRGFIGAASLDLNAPALVVGGLMLNLAELIARREPLPMQDAFAVGLLTGAQFFLPRLAFVYPVSAVLFFLLLATPVRRRLYIPSRAEMRRGWLNRLLSSALVLSVFLSVMAFFTSDSFFGVNAESNLRFTVLLAIAIAVKHRWRAVFGRFSNIGAIGAGLAATMLPGLLLNWNPPVPAHQISGLVRWSDIQLMLEQVPARIGGNFNAEDPLRLGLVAAVAAALILILGWFNDKRERFIGALAQLALAFAAWFGLHGQEHLAGRDFFIVLYPLYVAAGFAAARSRLRFVVLALSLVVLAGGAADLVQTLQRFSR